MSFSILVACTPKGGIASKGHIPWYIAEDLRVFQQVTSFTSSPHKTNAIIMGRKTWEALPKRPFSNRRNVVLSRSKDIRGCETYTSLDVALHVLSREPDVESIFVIGGGEVFQEALAHPGCRQVFLTLVDLPVECDTFFPLSNLYADWDMTSLSAPLLLADGENYCLFAEYAKRKHGSGSASFP